MKRWLLAIALFGLAAPALAQSVQQASPVTPGHAAAWRANGVIGDAGGSAAPTQANAGGIFGGLNVLGGGCVEDGYNNLTLSPSGYHQLCLFPNSLGGGLISYEALNGASPLPLNINLNGTSYAFPPTGSGNVLGPNSSTIGHVATWNNTSGTLLADSTFLAGITLSPLNVKGANGNVVASYIEGYGSTVSPTAGGMWIEHQSNSSNRATIYDWRELNAALSVIDQAAAINLGFQWWDSGHEQTDYDFAGYRNGQMETFIHLSAGCQSGFNTSINNAGSVGCPSSLAPEFSPFTSGLWNLGAAYNTWHNLYLDGNAIIGGTITVAGPTLIFTSSSLSSSPGSGAGTLTNAPSAGNPTKWIAINDNGTARFIPAW